MKPYVPLLLSVGLATAGLIYAYRNVETPDNPIYQPIYQEREINHELSNIGIERILKNPEEFDRARRLFNEREELQKSDEYKISVEEKKKGARRSFFGAIGLFTGLLSFV